MKLCRSSTEACFDHCTLIVISRVAHEFEPFNLCKISRMIVKVTESSMKICAEKKAVDGKAEMELV